MENINYTIIIPHKNTPELLEKCISSIPRRNDIQIIVVDDNSDPVVADFDNFKKKFVYVDFVCLTEQQSRGAGKARNIGLERARGKWLIFSDSDDYFTEDFTVYLDRYLDTDFDIIMFDVESRDMETLKTTPEGERLSNILHAANISDKAASEHFWFNHEVPWGKMIRKKLIDEHNIKFDEVWASNDTMFMLKCFFYAQKMTFEDKVLYCWIIRTNSLVHSKPILRNVMARYEVDLIRNRFCIDNGKREYTRSIANWILEISKFGIKPIFQSIQLCMKYRINPFTKCGNWFHTMKDKMK